MVSEHRRSHVYNVLKIFIIDRIRKKTNRFWLKRMPKKLLKNLTRNSTIAHMNVSTKNQDYSQNRSQIKSIRLGLKFSQMTSKDKTDILKFYVKVTKMR